MGQQIEKKKHVAIRSCIATGVKKPKGELMRFVQDPSTGKILVDLKGKIRARGANLDMTEQAFDLMQKKKALVRALKLSKDLTIEEYQELKQEFLNAIEERHFRQGNKSVKIRISKEDLKKLEE